MFEDKDIHAKRRDIINRFHFTLSNAHYSEIDTVLTELKKKPNFANICFEFFSDCMVDSKGILVPGGFFKDANRSASLFYSMFEMLGSAPGSLRLKHEVSRIQVFRKDFTGEFRVPPALFFLPNLEILAIREFGINELPSTVGSARSLLFLDISYNKFSRFPPNLVNLKHLLAINLSYNNINELPENLKNLTNLRNLYLCANNLKTLPGSLHKLQYLCSLDLSMNKITKVPDSLNAMQALRELKLSYNKLSAGVEAQWEKRIADRQ